MGVYVVDKLMAEARRIAAEYRRATGKTLPISGEIAVNDAINLLGLAAAPLDADGYGAIRSRDGVEEKLLIKGRVVFDQRKGGHRLGQLKLDKPWDAAVLVIMNDSYEACEIFEVGRDDLEAALPEHKRNKRGALSVARFRTIGRRVWTREDGVDDGSV